MLSNIRFLGRRGIPLRGDGDGNNSNFTQIFCLRTEYNPSLSKWLFKKTYKYTSWQIEMLKVMALEVLRYITASHRSPNVLRYIAASHRSPNVLRYITASHCSPNVLRYITASHCSPNVLLHNDRRDYRFIQP